MAREKVKITYSTLATPNPLVDQYYDEAVEQMKGEMGKNYPMYINGKWVSTDETFTKISPIDTSLVVGHFAQGNTDDVSRAVAAARKAFPGWRDTPWQDRIVILRKAADIISDRLFEIGAVLSIEVGKNRLEALGDVEETADLIRYCCDAMEENNGFDRQLLSESERHHNRSILKPYGVWGVIAPFNFPAALSGGPCGGALVTGNTVVLKPADDAPFTSYLIAECFHDGGIPAGVFNMVLGGDEPGKALVANKDVNGITFTGSYDVGMSIMRNFAASGDYMRPVVAEMGGKNPTIITEKADLDKASLGVMRSAFGLTGQKCSACSRVYVHNSIKNEFVDRLVNLTKEKVTVGDPTRKENYMGPIINKQAYDAYKKYARELKESGRVRLGAEVIEADRNGYYVAPTIVEDLPEDHYLWQHEMFAPIVVVSGFDSKEEAMEKANDVKVGLTAGFYGEDQEEVDWFLNNIQAGVLYVNRDTGATTGAWPGYQSFGGWKGSTGTGKAAGSFYYLQQYMREQSHTVVDR
jgi:1-pyrroline-5-carboxylate dehydrogenase